MCHVPKHGLLELGPQFHRETVLETISVDLRNASEINFVHNVDTNFSYIIMS